MCNKYFLKTHKLKVHGVGPDSVVSSSTSVNVLASSENTEDDSEQQQHHSRSSFDASPPQLFVDEMNLNAAEPGVIPSPDALTASVNNFISGSSHSHSSLSTDSNEQSKTSVCELCSKSFPTKFLHVHMNNVHGIQQAMGTVNGGTKNAYGSGSLKRSLTNGGAATSTVRLKQTPQVQLRVTCQVCKKVSEEDERLLREHSISTVRMSFSRNYVINTFYVLTCVMFTISPWMIFV